MSSITTSVPVLTSSNTSSRNRRRSSDRLWLVANTFLGATIGDRYRVSTVIGAGGMGTVYDAVDLVTGKLVAIKALNPRRFTKENLRRFRREAQTALTVRHPSLCDVHRFGVHASTPYLVMERLEGETIRCRVKRLGAFSVADTITIGIQLLDALSATHAAKILHRDVKPGNVFITTPPGAVPSVKLIDFGLARYLPTVGVEDTAITTTGMIPGTPAYLSPEQIACATDLDERVDVWAAGLTMFEMLAGAGGFKSNNNETLLYNIMFAPLSSIRDFRKDVPEAIDFVLARALAKRREERFMTARTFRNALVEAWARHRFEGLRRGALVSRGVISDTDDSGVIRFLR